MKTAHLDNGEFAPAYKMRDLFSVGRYEHNRPYRHIFYLPHRIYERLIAAKPVYILGGRGSGKTSLLKILDWKERLYNKTLSKCFDNNPFSDRILGVYLKLPKEHLGTFDRWLSSYEDVQAASVFGIYLDLAWVEEILNAIFELASRDIIKMTLSEQSQLIDKIYCDKIFSFLFPNREKTVSNLLYGIRSSRERLKYMGFLKEDLKVFLGNFPLLEPGEFGRRFANLVFQEAQIEALQEWTIKICYDEGEALSWQQQLCLNSATRNTQAPLSYVFAFVSPNRNLTLTIYPNLTVSLSDCEPIELDETKPAEFRDLVEGVAQARIDAFAPLANEKIDLPRVFGSFSVNALLDLQLKESVSSFAKDLLVEADLLKRNPFFSRSDDSGELPIYQAYLIKQGVADIPSSDSPAWANRAQESAELRKRMMAAYFSLCRDLAIKPLYAGWRTAVNIADNSVRDMLFQLDQVYIKHRRDLLSMLHVPLNPREQDSAIRTTSELKFGSLPEWVRIPHEQVRAFVEVFGNLTREFQTSSEDGQHLRSSERGIFVIEKNAFNNPRFTEYRRILEEAIYAGYLVSVPSRSGDIWFRVHRSLAPHFGFSPRGPYYPISVTISDFGQISDKATSQSIEEIVESITQRIAPQDNQLRLFDGN